MIDNIRGDDTTGDLPLSRAVTTKYAIIDTETSGLFNFKLPADGEGQPRLAHFAMILVGVDDNGFVHERTVDMLVKPDGWQMTPEATAINGLTTEKLMADGQPVATILDAYVSAIQAAYVLAAFNTQFDSKVMRGELRRAGRDDLFETTPNICIMRALTDICQVPRKKGNGFKFPTLAEACRHFGIEQPQAHSALADAQSALQLLHHLHMLGSIPSPEVHYAKERLE